MENIAAGVVIAVLFILYFLPSQIADAKQHQYGVFLVNLLLGWTVVGWFVAFIWACSGNKEAANDKTKTRCPSCAEYVQKKACVCRYCQTKLVAA